MHHMVGLCNVDVVLTHHLYMYMYMHVYVHASHGRSLQCTRSPHAPPVKRSAPRVKRTGRVKRSGRVKRTGRGACEEIGACEKAEACEEAEACGAQPGWGCERHACRPAHDRGRMARRQDRCYIINRGATGTDASATATAGVSSQMTHFPKVGRIDELEHRPRSVGNHVASRRTSGELLDEVRGHLFIVRVRIALTATSREQSCEASHLPARVACLLQLPMVVHDTALPHLVASRGTRQDCVVRARLRALAAGSGPAVMTHQTRQTGHGLSGLNCWLRPHSYRLGMLVSGDAV